MLYELEKHGNKMDYLQSAGKKDILVGIPSFRNESTIGAIIQIAARGLNQYFGGLKTAIMNSDGGSPDDTRQIFKDTYISSRIDRISSLYPGRSGKGSAVENIISAAGVLEADTVIMLDSDLRSITPQWIQLLADPIVRDELDYITPYYARHKYDGTLTGALIYPLLMGIWGAGIRHPMGGELSVSGKALKMITDDPIWQKYDSSYSADLKLTVMALAKGMRIGQAPLGIKNHDARDPSIFDQKSFNQIIGTFFELIGEYSHLWLKETLYGSVPKIQNESPAEPNPVNAGYSSVIKKFTDGFCQFREEWEKYLSDENYQLLNFIMDGVRGRSFQLDDRQWSRIVYDFLISYHKYPNDKVKILESFSPLYFLKLADFMIKTEKLSSLESEEIINETAERFFLERDYLVCRWNLELSPVHSAG